MFWRDTEQDINRYVLHVDLMLSCSLSIQFLFAWNHKVNQVKVGSFSQLATQSVTNFKARSGCLRPCPAKLQIVPRVEIPQPLSACVSVLSHSCREGYFPYFGQGWPFGNLQPLSPVFSVLYFCEGFPLFSVVSCRLQLAIILLAFFRLNKANSLSTPLHSSCPLNILVDICWTGFRKSMFVH